MDAYIEWLKRTGVPVFEMSGTWWRLYEGALVPACLKPQPLQPEPEEAKNLLKRSGATLLRYFTRTFNKPTDFWYSACSEYGDNILSARVRREIRHAYRDCSVRTVEPAWLAENGYDCYLAAFSRYSNARPVSRQQFVKECIESIGGPFEYWSVFVGDRLAGYEKCVIGDDHVAGLVQKMDPALLHLRSTYALTDAILRAYVVDGHKMMTIGFRPVAHKTSTHDFLTRFGYQRVYCDLRIVYRPSLGAMVGTLYPLRSVLSFVPNGWTIGRMKSLLAQETIRRSFEPRDGSITQSPCV